MATTKFQPTPSTQFAAAFDGMKRTCKRFALKRVKAVSGRGFTTALRCVDFKKGRGRPPCHPYKRDGGRSKGLINKQGCRRGKRG